MPLIPAEIVNEIRQRTDIVDVIGQHLQLHKRGKNHWGICPFHKDTKPSLAVSSDKQIFKCFVCGAAGNVFGFISRLRNVPFNEAVVELGKRIGMDVDQYAQKRAPIDPKLQAIFDANASALAYFKYCMDVRPPQAVADYAKKRGLDKDIRETFGIGYAPANRDGLLTSLVQKDFDQKDIYAAGLISERDGKFHDIFYNRLIFALHDADGRVAGFSGRALTDDQEPKYMNTTETPVFRKSNVLYNYHRVRAGQRVDVLYVMEGFMDVIAAHRAGIANAVATMGTALTQDHYALIKRITNNVRLSMDSDNAGRAAAVRAGTGLFLHGFKVEIVAPLSEGKDIDETLAKKGADAVKKSLSQVVSFLGFKYDELVRTTSSSPEDKLAALKTVISDVKNVVSEEESGVYWSWIAEHSGLSEKVVQDAAKATMASQSTTEFGKAVGESRDYEAKERYLLAEEQILKMMLSSPEEAIVHYREKLNFMNNPVNMEIASALSIRHEKKDDLKIADMMNDLSVEAQEKLSSLSAEDETRDLEAIDRRYSKTGLNDALRIVISRRFDAKIQELVALNSRKDKSNEEKNENLKKIVKLRQQKESALKKLN